MNKTLKIILLTVALLLPQGLLVAQGGRIAKGTVRDDQGEPLIGAGVVVKEVPGKGTQTDLDGNFTLQLPDKAKTLVFSFIGMKSIEVPLKGANLSNMSVTLEYESDFLDQVVVTGYSQTTTKRITAGCARHPFLLSKTMATTASTG